MRFFPLRSGILTQFSVLIIQRQKKPGSWLFLAYQRLSGWMWISFKLQVFLLRNASYDLCEFGHEGSCSWPGDYPDACLLATAKWRRRRFSTGAASVCSERILSCQAKNLVSNYPRCPRFDVLDCNDAFKFQSEGRMAAHRSTCVFTPREGHRPRGPIHWLHKQGVTKCHFPGSRHTLAISHWIRK